MDIEEPINLNITYNETNQEAYKELSEDNKDFEVKYIQEINDNINLSFTSNMDLKNDFSPYRSELLISLFDECSQLNIGYINTRYNDSYNTSPTETISITYSMDYLGFFGYEQSTDLFF